MTEFWRIQKLLIYKNLLIYKRQWYILLIGHLLIPLSIFMIANQIVGTDHDRHSSFKPAATYLKKSVSSLNDQMYDDNYTVYFTPNTNSFANTMMDKLDGCFDYHERPHPIIPVGFSSEEQLFRHLQNVTNMNSALAIIFEGDNIDESIEHLKYKICSTELYENRLYIQNNFFEAIHYYTKTGLVQLQICLDEAFIKLKAKNAVLPEMFVQQNPYPAHEEMDAVGNSYPIILCVIVVFVFVIPLVIETAKVIREKLSGVNVLMSMNGVSTPSTLFSWLITGWIFISILCVIPLICSLTISSSDYSPAILQYGNIFIVWLVLEIYVIHLLAYGIHACQYFSKYIIFTFSFLILNLGPIILENVAFDEKNLFIVPYLGIFFPNLLLYRAMDELQHYETLEVGIQWKNLFTVGNSMYEVGGSIGMIFVLSAIGIVFQFFMAVYISGINPGKYGTKKHPLFFLKTKITPSDQNNLENVEFNERGSKYFESVSSNIYSPGIQIRNLKKIYNIGLINKKVIEALRGVSINFYKGQITSLLGHNGAGKTTLMSIITGMMSPSEGTVIINSKNMRDFQSEVMSDMGLCPQQDMFFPNLTVYQHFSFFAKLKGKGKSSAEIEDTIKAVLTNLKLHDKRNALPNSLSGGQKRRLCFGMAIAGNPSILILDEPTSGLDPESRRVIWDMLLKMRGQKTILISTHDMEEADILGDRIAIIHKGGLKSYGTPMFMKKLLGQGNLELTLSIGIGFDIEKIRNELNCEMNVVSEDSSTVILTIPNSPSAPDSLDKIQRKKKELRITGLSVSLISLEQVFLKVTEEVKDPTLSQPNVNMYKKLTGFSHTIHIFRALFYKKMLYTIHNWLQIIFILFWMFISLFIISVILKFVFIVDYSSKENSKFPILLDMYKKPITFYQSYDEIFGQHYKGITEKYGGTAIDVKNSDLNNELMKYGTEDLSSYDTHVIAAVEFTKNKTDHVSVNAFFSNKATFSFPISLNLMTNALLKTLVGSDYSISVSYERIMIEWLHYNSSYSTTIFTGYITATIFCFFLFTAIAIFAIHPRQEASTNVKQLQRMTGARTFSYWGTMFIFDFIILLFIVLLTVGGLLIMNNALDFRMFGETEFKLLLLSAVLFLINILPVLYIFSFTELRASTVVKILIYIPLIFVILEIIMMVLYIVYVNSVEILTAIRKIQKRIFLLIPHISFMHSQISIQLTAHGNSRCKMLSNEFYDSKCNLTSNFDRDFCCDLDCYDGICKKPVKYFNNFAGIEYEGAIVEDTSLEESLIYLGITPILYFAILIALDNQLFKKLVAKVKKHVIDEYPMDDKVKYEKSTILQKISTFYTNQSNIREFLVYELSKRYKNVIAVKDVNFSVKSRECFGLLGVNGAGKSTTFRMMTGAEVPDHGVMYMDQRSWIDNADYFFSRMGYCPQNDALIKCLNSFDHLRLFARLRGVPENSVEVEVRSWIQRLNLSSCASNPCGTYSGGNKRRLNIAIALIGNPDLVLLDEPTTGVDPGARRSLWNVIQSCQESGQAIILTSHSMEECEALCNRLAIMVDGKFVCIGQSQELKQRFGAGYDIRLKMNPEKAQSQIAEIKEHMLHALNCELVDENLGYLMYHVKSVETSWRTMYDAVNSIKEKCDCIDDFSVLSSTLEQLFLLFARAADRQAQ